jgi:hypothetical protein
MRSSAPVLATFLAFALTACSDPAGDDTGAGSSSTGLAEDPNPHALVTAKLDGIGLCGFEGATAIRFIARRVGCEQGPPAPCTLEVSPYREYDGTVLTCPNSQTLIDVQVSVPASGRYQLDARVMTGSGFQSECFGHGGDVPTLVTTADLDARREIFVETTNQPCPAP